MCRLRLLPRWSAPVPSPRCVVASMRRCICCSGGASCEAETMTDIVRETPCPTGQPLRSVPRDTNEMPPARGTLGTLGTLGTRGTRDRLPQRRAHELLEFQHAGIAYVAGIGRFADGR